MGALSSEKSQVIFIFVFFLLLLTMILGSALAVMWTAESKSRRIQRESLRAFYLAQAGIERGKIELAYDETWLGGGAYPLGDGEYEIISVINVVCPAGPYDTCREITSVGRIRDAERRITIRVSLDTFPPLDPPNTPGDEEQLPWSWQEI